MPNSELNKRIVKATKWSTVTEIIAKLITPITNMILARLLAPEAFGVVTTIGMIISFADMFTDAGFQKYIIQHHFKDDEEKHNSITVAFWTNLVISLVLWGMISLFANQIATLLGNDGLGNTIIIACVSLPLTSFSSIQMALYKREFEFKTLFYTRIVGICIPFIVTIPLVVLGAGYWGLIIGTICGNLSNAVILTINSTWKPNRFFSMSLLIKMLSFSLWSLAEAISIWLTTWIGTFIISNQLSTYYLGLYKTSMNTVNAIMAIITSSTTPILFSALSKLQKNKNEYEETFFRFQWGVGMLVIPLGVGIYVYRDVITNVMLGAQWKEAELLIGLWGLTSAISIVFANYCSEVFRSKGRPQLSFWAQVIHLIFLIPTCSISVKYGYTTLVYARAFIRLQFILVQLIIMHYIIGISAIKMIVNVSPFIIAAIVMGRFGDVLHNFNTSWIWTINSILLCVIIYFTCLLLSPKQRKEILKMLNKSALVKKIKVKVNNYIFNME